MQNSGLGNSINPLTSLVDKEVYNIPLLLLIGWRGEPGVKDEPQHVKQGKVTIPLLETLGIHNEVMVDNDSGFPEQLCRVIEYIVKTNEPFALVVRKDTFDNYTLQSNKDLTDYSLSREEAIGLVVDTISEKDVVVSTTGMISRELFELREARQQGHERDFLTVGSMGHASQIALGIALQQQYRKVYCFDGDGAVLMHMGSLPVTGALKPQNYIHIIFNNGAHDSVGGQPTVGFITGFQKIAIASGYSAAYVVDRKDDLKNLLDTVKSVNGPVLIEIRVKKGARPNLGRPTTTPVQNKESFMQFLKSSPHN